MQHGVADYIEITAFRNYDEGLDIYVRRSDWVDDGRYAHYQTAGTTDPRLWAEHCFDFVGGYRFVAASILSETMLPA